jgi:predicted nucleic acid-binding Zn ribbon protein
MAHPQLQLATRPRVRRVVLLWAALIAAFLVVWQVLSASGSR